LDDGWPQCAVGLAFCSLNLPTRQSQRLSQYRVPCRGCVRAPRVWLWTARGPVSGACRTVPIADYLRGPSGAISSRVSLHRVPAFRARTTKRKKCSTVLSVPNPSRCPTTPPTERCSPPSPARRVCARSSRPQSAHSRARRSGMLAMRCRRVHRSTRALSERPFSRAGRYTRSHRSLSRRRMLSAQYNSS
jgi:hypothetical protein